MATRQTRMLVTNLFARNQSLAPRLLNNYSLRSFSSGAPIRYYTRPLGYSGADGFSSRVLDEFSPLKRGENHLIGPIYWQGSLGSAAWNASFVSMRMSTVSGKAVIDEIATASSDIEEKAVEKEETAITKPLELDMEKLKEKGLVHSSYWGLSPAKVSREDGSPWPWNSFRFLDVIQALKLNSKTHIQEPWRYLDYLSHLPESCLTFLFWFDDWGIPSDYRHMEGFGVHTFKVKIKASILSA